MIPQSSQRPPELQFYTKKSYRILQLQFQLQFYKGTHTPSTYYMCTLHSREFSIQNPILHAEDKELFEYYYYIQRAKRPSFQKRNSTHRRQGDLLEMHPCVLQDLPMTFQAFQPQDLPKALQLLQLLQRYSRHSSRSWPSSLSRQFYKFYIVPVSPGNPPHSSILRLECILYNFYSSIGFHRKLHRVPVGQLQTFLQTLHSSKKGRCCDIGQTCISKRCQDDIFPRIEFIPSFVLSSDNTNYKNDIQLFHQLFDELSVNRNYH